MARTISGDDPQATAVYTDVDGDTHFNASSVFFEGALLRLGAPQAVTIASGVAAGVTSSFVVLTSESGTTDQLDSITLAATVPAVGDGDLLLLISKSTDTITVDDATINLGAATRAIAPGGCLLLRYDAAESQWTEVIFLAGADNV